MAVSAKELARAVLAMRIAQKQYFNPEKRTGPILEESPKLERLEREIDKPHSLNDRNIIMPKMLLNQADLHIINHVLCWKPSKGVDRGVGIQDEPACVVVVMTCKSEKVAVNLWTWDGEESLELLHDTAIALRAVARDVEKARSIKGDQFVCPVIDTTKMGQG